MRGAATHCIMFCLDDEGVKEMDSGELEQRGGSLHNMTDELIEILDNKENASQLSLDLIEDRHGNWVLSDHGGAILNESESQNIFGSPTGGTSLQKSSEDPWIDDGQSSDAREILEKLENRSFEEPVVANGRSWSGISPDKLKSMGHTKTQSSGSYYLDQDIPDGLSGAIGRAQSRKLMKYAENVDQINEEQSEYSVRIPFPLLDMVNRKRDQFFSGLLALAKSFRRDYTSAVKIVADTLLVEKTKFIFSKMRAARRNLLLHAILRLSLNKPAKKKENKLKKKESYTERSGSNDVESSVTLGGDMEQRHKFIQKIASSILQSRPEIIRE